MRFAVGTPLRTFVPHKQLIDTINPLKPENLLERNFDDIKTD